MELLSGLLLFGVLSIPFLGLFYNQNLRSFNSEIKIYLNEKALTLAVKRNPNDSDWETSPFSKLKNFEVTLGIINHVIFNKIFQTPTYFRS